MLSVRSHPTSPVSHYSLCISNVFKCIVYALLCLNFEIFSLRMTFMLDNQKRFLKLNVPSQLSSALKMNFSRQLKIVLYITTLACTGDGTIKSSRSAI